jgi:hypothetical protein
MSEAAVTQRGARRGGRGDGRRETGTYEREESHKPALAYKRKTKRITKRRKTQDTKRTKRTKRTNATDTRTHGHTHGAVGRGEYYDGWGVQHNATQSSATEQRN